MIIQSSWTSTGDTFFRNFAIGQGGILTNSNAFEGVMFRDGLFSQNFGSIGSIVCLTSRATQAVIVENTVFEDNYAYLYGGFLLQSSNSFISSSTFRHNIADGPGGALMLAGGGTGDVLSDNVTFTMDIKDCLFEENAANLVFRQKASFFDGGAIFLNGVDACNIVNSTFIRNTAVYGGTANLSLNDRFLHITNPVVCNA